MTHIDPPTAQNAAQEAAMIFDLPDLPDEVYDAADAIHAAMEAAPDRTWIPSELARKVHADHGTVRAALAELIRLGSATTDGRGAWSRYAPSERTRRLAAAAARGTLPH